MSGMGGYQFISVKTGHFWTNSDWVKWYDRKFWTNLDNLERCQ
jgi:hypothetical protein